jgi:NAD(P)-dependent dehydrogenase (short-subunit alcohol dehydrogenase family)
MEHTTEQDFDNAFALNVKGPYFLVKVCTLPALSFARRHR